MKHIKLFEDFSSREYTDIGLKVYKIQRPPESLKKDCIVEITMGDVMYYIVEMKSSDLSFPPASINRLMLPDFNNSKYSSSNFESIKAVIRLEKFKERGISKEAYDWMDSGAGDFEKSKDPWEDIVKDAAVNDKLTDSDYKLLGKKKEDYKTGRSATKFGLRG